MSGRSIKSLKKLLCYVEDVECGKKPRRRRHGFGDSASVDFLKQQAINQIRKSATIKTQFQKLSSDELYQSVVKDPAQIQKLIDKLNEYIDLAKSLTPLPYKPPIMVAKVALNKFISIANKQFPPAQTVKMIDDLVKQIIA